MTHPDHVDLPGLDRGPEPAPFTIPSAAVQGARLALARLEQGLHAASDPLAPSVSLDHIAMAFLALEDVAPPYPPLPAVTTAADPRTDPRADLAEALSWLEKANAETDRVGEKLRYSRAARDLTALAHIDPHRTAP